MKHRSRVVILFAASCCAALSSIGGATAFEVQPVRRPTDRQTDRPTDEKPPTAALLDLDRSPVGALLEQRLLQGKNARWLERTEIEMVLKEQRLQALFAPATTARRVALGRLLKANVLVLLRTLTEPKPHVELVVCETDRGLRLLVERVLSSRQPEEDAKKLQQFVQQALGMYRQTVTDVCAVPAFVSHDLTYQRDHLKTAWAKLVRRIVMQRPGLLLVELEEAHAIAREIRLTGGEVRRPLPLYLLGEYRHENGTKSNRVKIGLKLMRGEKTLSSIDRADLPSDEASAFVRLAASQLLGKAAKTKQPLADPRQEAEQLHQRAKNLMHLGDFDEAATLIEASLLLRPNQESLHHDAIVIATERVYKFRYINRRDRRYRDLVGIFLRGLEHLEQFMRLTRDISKYRVTGQTTFLAMFRICDAILSMFPDTPDDVKKFAAAAKNRQREKLLQIASQVARAGRYRKYERWLLRWAAYTVPKKERLQVIFRFIETHQDLPDIARRAREYSAHGRAYLHLNTPEGKVFLDRLEALPRRDMKQLSAYLRRRMLADVKKYSRRPPMPITVPVESGVQELKFVPVKFTWHAPGGTPQPVTRYPGWMLPAGEGIDVAWGIDRSLYVMKQPGRLKRVWRSGDLNIWFYHVCFDGKYVWAAGTRLNKPPQLLVLDPDSEQVWEISGKDGLPVQPADGSSSTAVQSLAIAPLGPGRICAAGSFGRTWLATIRFDPRRKEKVEVNIFHEAREAPNREDKQQWKSTTVSFKPTFMFTLEDKPDAHGKIARRVLLGRSSLHADVMSHPLVIDPERSTVEVLQDKLWGEIDRQEFDVHQGAVYITLAVPSGKKNQFTTKLFRLRFPGRKLEPVIENAREAWVRVYRGAYHFLGYQHWTARPGDKSFRLVAANVPWYYMPRTFPERQLLGAERLPIHTPVGRYRLLTVARSNHFGLVVTGINSDREYRSFQVVVPDDGFPN